MISEITLMFARNTGNLERLIEDLSDPQLLFQPVSGMNHIAWNVGHLVYSFQAIGDEMGIPQWLSTEWLDLFAQGSRLQLEKERYPSKTALLEALQDGKGRILQKLESMSENDMSGQLPDERFRHVFPTLGHAVLNTLVAHFNIHHGYIIALRKMACASTPA